MPSPILFAKYHGTGNDFILIDNRTAGIALSSEAIAGLCHRRFGIGADGLMLLEKSQKAAFRMVYYNADGGQSTLCGNGSRCVVAFAHQLGIFVGSDVVFEASDGLHQAHVLPDGRIALEMHPVTTISRMRDGLFLDTGSPHLVLFRTGLEAVAIREEGARHRYDPVFASGGGTNVNFVTRVADNHLRVRTYERGVEDETLSCGTGVTAAALAAAAESPTGHYHTQVETPGGMLEVAFYMEAGRASGIVLTGPARFVFEGQVLPD